MGESTQLHSSLEQLSCSHRAVQEMRAKFFQLPYLGSPYTVKIGVEEQTAVWPLAPVHSMELWEMHEVS